MGKLKAVYCEQFGAFWRLTPYEWRMLCVQGARGEGHTLPPNGRLRHRPGQVIGKVMESGGEPGDSTPYYWVLDPYKETALFYRPLDWEEEDYQSALKELEEKEK
jgi:hypothetical protein